MSATRIGRYEILRPLGRGAMGLVYLAKDPAIDRIIALKTIRFDAPSASFNRDEAQARFLKEAKISGRLQHPNIVTIFDVGEDQGTLYLAMEFVSGGSLAQKLSDPNELPVSERIRIVAEVADALAHAHERGVIHRDIKPANILLTEALLAKVTDFGIGKLLTGDSELTSTGQMVGSPAYMSPEQIRGEKVDVRSDIFSLGVVLYQSVTGKKPFPADTLTTLVFQILNQEPVDALSHRSDLPPELSTILRRCLAKRRDDRYHEASLLAEDLRLVLGISPVTSTAAMSESRARRVRQAAAQAGGVAPQATVQMPSATGGAPLGATAPTSPGQFPQPSGLGVTYDPSGRTGAAPAAGGGIPVPLVGPEPSRGVSATGAVGRSGVTSASGTRTGRPPNPPRPGIVAAAVGGALIVLSAFGYLFYRQLTQPNAFGGGAPAPTAVAGGEPAPSPSPIGGAVVPTPSLGAEEPTVAVPTETIKVVESPLPTAKVPTTPTPAPARPTATPRPTVAPTPTEPPRPTSPPLKPAQFSFLVRRAVKVNVSPSQARLFLDGRYVGISDDWDDSGGGSVLAFQAEGKHRLRFAYPGYRDLLVDVTIAASAVEDEFEIELELEKGTPEGPTGPDGKLRGPNYKTAGPLRFQVDPPDAMVSIDGKALGPASQYAAEPLVLREMRVYDVVLSSPGRETKTLRVIVSPVTGKQVAEVKEKLKAR